MTKSHSFNAFCSNLDWLWQDYILYEYYKRKFLKRIKAFGREKIDAEKENLRKTFNQTIIQCHQPENDAISKSAGHFCGYYETREFRMIDEVRDLQRKKSLEVHSKSCEVEEIPG